MTENDVVALKLAMEQTKRDPERAGQIAEMLREQSWAEVAEFASYHMQMETLHLEGFELPPCVIDDPDETLAGPNDQAWTYGAHSAAKLLKRMLACGVSKFHPDPLQAIKKAKG